MHVLYFILLLVGLICFLAAVAGVRTGNRQVDLVALGLAFWIAVPMIQMAQRL